MPATQWVQRPKISGKPPAAKVNAHKGAVLPQSSHRPGCRRRIDARVGLSDCACAALSSGVWPGPAARPTAHDKRALHSWLDLVTRGLRWGGEGKSRCVRLSTAPPCQQRAGVQRASCGSNLPDQSPIPSDGMAPPPTSPFTLTTLQGRPSCGWPAVASRSRVGCSGRAHRRTADDE